MAEKRRFCVLLDEAINDETKAPVDYNKLRLAAGTVEDLGKVMSEISATIDHISSEEEKHRESLIILQTKYCR